MSGDVLVRPSDKWNDLAPKFDAHVHVHVHVRIHGACICLGGQGHGAKIHALVPPPFQMIVMVVIYERAKEVRDGTRTAHENVFTSVQEGGTSQGVRRCQNSWQPA